MPQFSAAHASNAKGLPGGLAQDSKFENFSSFLLSLPSVTWGRRYLGSGADRRKKKEENTAVGAESFDSPNSIEIGRMVLQIKVYVSAHAQ